MPGTWCAAAASTSSSPSRAWQPEFNNWAFNLPRGVCFANVTTWECERGATVLDLEGGVVRQVVVPPRDAH